MLAADELEEGLTALEDGSASPGVRQSRRRDSEWLRFLSYLMKLKETPLSGS